jgi:hypothetical protein
MISLSDGFSLETLFSCGDGEGRRRSGGEGMGDGGSISRGIRFISLLRLLELWGLQLFL